MMRRHILFWVLLTLAWAGASAQTIQLSAKAGGNKVTLRNMNDDIKNVFKMTGLINLFDVE